AGWSYVATMTAVRTRVYCSIARRLSGGEAWAFACAPYGPCKWSVDGGDAMLREMDVELEGAPSTAKRLRGRVAVVTGSSRGIGRGIARVLASAGASGAGHYCRREEQAASLAEEIEHLGSKAQLVQGDLGRPEDCHKVLTVAARELGPVEILVNNAGVNRDRTLRKMTAAEWDEVIQVNLNSVFYCTKAV